ncbi:hypothetical protein DPX16_11972 [Anabarilius grahami]|uniref:Uncharacterized protein n=1 Tax=Anabarilius grahami TaxID=495550 RepID=A0A3N0YDJ8_ANAGA|nr:hypothetical protein DPX16_11972 [Anabarilius grahami]
MMAGKQNKGDHVTYDNKQNVTESVTVCVTKSISHKSSISSGEDLGMAVILAEGSFSAAAISTEGSGVATAILTEGSGVAVAILRRGFGMVAIIITELRTWGFAGGQKWTDPLEGSVEGIGLRLKLPGRSSVLPSSQACVVPSCLILPVPVLLVCTVLSSKLSIPVATFSPCQAARPVQCLIVPCESNYV